MIISLKWKIYFEDFLNVYIFQVQWDLYWVAKNSSYLLISLTECAQIGFQRPLCLNLSLYSLSKGQQCPLTLVCKASHLRPFSTLTLEWGQLSREVLLWIKSSPLIYLYQSKKSLPFKSNLYQRKQIWHWSANEKLKQCFSLSLPVDLFFSIHLAAVIFKEVENLGTFWLLRHSEVNWCEKKDCLMIIFYTTLVMRGKQWWMKPSSGWSK